MMERMGDALLHSLWMGAVVAAGLWVALGVLRSSRARYGAAMVAMVPFVLMPLAALLPWEPTTRQLAGSPSGELAAAAGELPGTDWKAILPLLWAVGALGFAVRALGGWAVVERLRRQGTPVMDPVVLQAVARWAEELGVTRRIQVVITAVESPVTAGWWRPVVMLPVSALTGLGRAELEAVLAHELAHLARHDYFVNWWQMGMEVLYFHHPAAWWISAVLRREREHCCDETAVRLSKDRTNYARALVKLAELQACGAPALAGRSGGLEERLMKILGREKRTAFPGVAAILTVSATVLVAVAVGAQEKPTGCASEPAGKDWLENKVQWIIQAPERAAYERLSAPAECDQFVKQFWERRGAAAKVEHERRMKWAAERFPKVPDARRVHVVYGPPDEIESHPVEGFDKWLYHDAPGLGKNFDVTFRTE